LINLPSTPYFVIIISQIHDCWCGLIKNIYINKHILESIYENNNKNNKYIYIYIYFSKLYALL